MRKVEVLPYDPAWHILFKQEAQQLAQIFSAEIVAIHHIGSTSIIHTGLTGQTHY